MPSTSSIKLSRHDFTLGRSCFRLRILLLSQHRSCRSAPLVDLQLPSTVRSATDMRLSLLRSWRSAADNDLHLGPSLVQCTPAQLSHHYHTHATWRRPLSPVLLACTFNRTVTGCQPSKHHGHSYSHQAGGEGGEPDVESSASASTATGFQLRQLHTRQAAEARTSDNAARGFAEFRDREPKQREVPRYRNAKLDTAGAAQKTFKRRKARFAKTQTEGVQSLGVDGSVAQEDETHFAYWIPELTAAALHLEALEKADEAARYAKETACRAEKAAHSASVCKGRYSEEDAIRDTDSLRIRAELVASLAEQLSNYAAEREKTYEAIRGELKTRIEAHPILWDTPKMANSKASGYKLRALVRLSCRVCGGPHPPAKCSLLFDGLKRDGVSEGAPAYKAARSIFEDRRILDKDFDEAMSYFLSKFTVSRSLTREIVPMSYSATADAPASAISKSSVPYT